MAVEAVEMSDEITNHLKHPDKLEPVLGSYSQCIAMNMYE
jgi:hypothetical protein